MYVTRGGGRSWKNRPGRLTNPGRSSCGSNLRPRERSEARIDVPEGSARGHGSTCSGSVGGPDCTSQDPRRGRLPPAVDSLTTGCIPVASDTSALSGQMPQGRQTLIRLGVVSHECHRLLLECRASQPLDHTRCPEPLTDPVYSPRYSTLKNGTWFRSSRPAGAATRLRSATPSATPSRRHRAP